MPPTARKASICVILVAVLPMITGCGEDRSNLLPRDTAERIEAELNEVRSMVKEGACLEALSLSGDVQTEVEALAGSIDGGLQRTLLDGVTELQITIQDTCVEADTGPNEAPAPEPAPEEVQAPEDESSGTTGDAGGTGTTDGGGAAPAPEPEPEPEPQPEPQPTPPDTGSGGVGPQTGGATP